MKSYIQKNEAFYKIPTTDFKIFLIWILYSSCLCTRSIFIFLTSSLSCEVSLDSLALSLLASSIKGMSSSSEDPSLSWQYLSAILCNGGLLSGSESLELSSEFYRLMTYLAFLGKFLPFEISHSKFARCKCLACTFSVDLSKVFAIM